MEVDDEPVRQAEHKLYDGAEHTIHFRRCRDNHGEGAEEATWVRQWLRQTRRIDAILERRETLRRRPSHHKQEFMAKYIEETIEAVRNPPGFQGGFLAWLAKELPHEIFDGIFLLIRGQNRDIL